MYHRVISYNPDRSLGQAGAACKARTRAINAVKALRVTCKCLPAPPSIRINRKTAPLLHVEILTECRATFDRYHALETALL